jgi:small-conductance mechanosensitive channel
MKLSDFPHRAGEILNTKLFTLGDTQVTLMTLVTAVFIVFLTLVISRLLRRGVERLARRRRIQDEGSVAAVSRLVHYLVLLVGIGVALDTAGVNLNALFAAGAVFAVGIGFAMKNIVENFVAGVILLIEGSIKPGNILEVEGRVVRVIQMGIRTTIVQTRDGEHLIVPNSVLGQSTVKNFTLARAVYRVRALVGVVYASDMALVRQILEGVAQNIHLDDTGRAPQVLLLGFGDNSVNWEVAVWMTDPWLSRQVLSRLNEAIWWALKERGIVIAFPQLDVHFDPPVAEGFARIAAVG